MELDDRTKDSKANIRKGWDSNCSDVFIAPSFMAE